MMYYKVELINRSEDLSYAYIFMDKDKKGIFVLSQNTELRKTLEAILGETAFVLSPGHNRPGYSSDGVVVVEPGTLYFYAAIPEILAWRGFRAYPTHMKQGGKK